MTIRATPEQLRDPDYFPGLASAIPLGLQHVLAMLVSNTTPAAIVAGAAGFGFDVDAFRRDCDPDADHRHGADRRAPALGSGHQLCLYFGDGADCCGQGRFGHGAADDRGIGLRGSACVPVAAGGADPLCLAADGDGAGGADDRTVADADRGGICRRRASQDRHARIWRMAKLAVGRDGGGGDLCAQILWARDMVDGFGADRAAGGICAGLCHGEGVSGTGGGGGVVHAAHAVSFRAELVHLGDHRFCADGLRLLDRDDWRCRGDLRRRGGAR
ncbi:hypothetical protein E4T56_gene9209, partial [Termitomyces sp. T112]